MPSTLTFPGRYDSLVRIAEFVRQAAKEADLDSFAIYAVETAVDEACTNIIEHAYHGENLGDIECSVNIDEDGLTITLRDRGLPFNPSHVPQPNLDAPLEDRESHGLGLFFMHQMMDEIHFGFEPGRGNILTMVKRKEKHAQ
jgi:serine/threonine-protein kinase RsbW